MTISTKIAIVIRGDLLTWQKLNVAAFLSSSIAIQFPETHGKAFVNASNSTYLPFIKQPMMVYKAINQKELNRCFERAKDRELQIGIYTEPLFSTKNEDENHIKIGEYSDENQTLVGVIIYGDNKKVNKALDGLKFHE